ncbi:MAG: hypothetical protein LBB89_01745 [Treponema sp.]|jgi:hypothetical protein|nr:hypothetical protein [Treponema sp.]
MKRTLLPLFFFLVIYAAGAQEHDSGYNPEVIRGEVWVDFEPMYGNRPDIEYPLSRETAGKRALQEAALYFSGMIYGWSFHYDIGEKARGIAEEFDVFEPLGEIRWGDPRLGMIEAEDRDMKLRVWADYQLSEVQQKRMQTWRTGTIRNAQAIGYCPLTGPSPDSGWLEIRNAVLKDAARTAVRAMLRGSERNRPKAAAGFISLASFPRFFVDSGQWAVAARFHVQINEVTPFAAY